MPIPNRRRHRQGAISILDVLIAFACAVVITASVAVGALTAVGAEARAQDNLLAAQCARQIIENVRSIRGARVAAGIYTDATTLGPVPQLARLTDSTVSAEVSPYHGTTLQVIVTVSWRSRAGHASRSTSVTALVAPDGVAP